MALFSKRSLEGYFMVDQRATGVPVDLPVGVGGNRSTMFEAATLTCSHCQRQMIRNPDRTRERGYCPKCDKYVCDQCEVIRAQSGECKTFKQLMDEVVEAVEKKKPLLILP